MEPKSVHTDAALPGDILKTVAYFDVFNYPVTTGQIYAFLPRNSVTPDAVTRTAEELVRAKKLNARHGYFLLSTSDSGIADQRLEGERLAQRMLSYARVIAMMLKQVPFIRGVFITGSLSKYTAGRDSDIDFMIVTAQNRLWIVRSMLTLFRKIFLLGNKKYFCTNYYVTEKGFAIERRNLYAAIEVVTTKAVWNADLFTQYQRSNSWTREFLPNTPLGTTADLLIPQTRSWFQRLCEFLISLFPLTILDRRLMEYHRTYWNSAYGHMSSEQRASMFIINHDASACWPDDQQQPVLSRYQQKLSALGLT